MTTGRSLPDMAQSKMPSRFTWCTLKHTNGKSNIYSIFQADFVRTTDGTDPRAQSFDLENRVIVATITLHDAWNHLVDYCSMARAFATDFAPVWGDIAPLWED